MATKQIGKLKLHWSKRGVAFKWGDGEIHRLSFEGKNQSAADNQETMQQPYASGSYTQPRDYADESYSGSDQDYAAPSQGYYGEQPYEGGKYRFLYSSDVLMYALLLLLPPLGIWILWKKEKFSTPVRTAVTAAAGIWFIVLLVWLFTAMLGGGSDQINTGAVSPDTVATPAPETQTAVPETQPDVDVTVPADPVATPIAAVGSQTDDLSDAPASHTVATSVSAGDYCYAIGTSQYFHSTQDCPSIEENTTRTTVALARSRGQIQCPVCYNTTDASGTANSYGTMTTDSTTIYATKKGKYYHVDQNCGGMTGAVVYTLAQAKKEGKKVCPTCIGIYYCTPTGKYYHTSATCSGMSGAQHTTAAAAEAAGKTKCPTCLANAKKGGSSGSSSATYYSTAKGKYYHSKQDCQGMKGATKVTAATIKKRGQKPCPVCIKSSTSSSSGQYYATRTGKYYHTNSTCSGMKGATKMSLTTAKKYGKKACPVCVAKSAGKSVSSKDTGSNVYYATSSGKYYHKTSSCSGMKNAKKITKATAEKKGKTPCPICLKSSATYVYGTSGGKYYHKTSSCSGIKNAKKMTLSAAKKNGKTACPVCYKSEAAKEKVYYATASNKYYHVKANCSGMKNATKVSLATAKSKGKTACPVCIGGKKETTYYYTVSNNKYYHTKSNCSGMTGAKKVTLSAAKKANKTACPVCVKKSVNPTPTPSAGKVYCYASSGSKYYHKNKTCSGLKHLKKVPLSSAKSKGKTACPVCVKKTVNPKNITTSYADKSTICYASSTSAYYHSDKSCVANLKKTTVRAAKNRGKTACPVCGKNMNTYVYVTRSGTKYHRTATCAGVANTYKISLTTALKKNYVRCTKCNAPKKK